MSDHMPDDLSAAGREVRAFTDPIRAEHAVVRNLENEWVLLRHAEVVQAACDDATFSSAISRHLQVPNGLDGASHSAFRKLIDRFFTPQALAPYVPLFHDLAAAILAALPRDRPVDAVREVGAVFAVRAQSGWLGWPAELELPLLQWMADNHAATRSGDPARTARVAQAFDAIIHSVVRPRREAGDAAPDDLTTQLLRSQVDGRPLTEPEVVSILRNWTGGDLGSIALCVGVVLSGLATHPDLLARLRTADDELIDATVDELLRLDDPFVSNRRITTCPVDIAGQRLPQGARVKLHWTSANRDESVFGAGEVFDPQRHRAANLVYGIGRHVCPGRPLATLQLRALVRAVLEGTGGVELDPLRPPVRAVSPVGGYQSLPLIVRHRQRANGAADQGAADHGATDHGAADRD